MAKQKLTTRKKILPPPKQSSRNISVLVVDDEHNMRKTLSAILRRENYDVETAVDGESAVQACAQRTFDVVLMDVRMPGIDGVEAFRQIRCHQESVRVILMSAYGLADLKQSALHEGVIAFLDKPLDVNKVIELIAQATETAILVIEGDAEIALQMSSTLKGQGCHVTVVDTPHEALELVEQIKYDIIFIDVSLPAMNGLDLYLTIKKITPRAIAVMVTGMEKECERLAREAVRQTAYTIIRKPLDLDHLLKLLEMIQGQTISSVIIKPQDDTI